MSIIYNCSKCKKATKHERKAINVKAGDAGYTKSNSYVCSECGFTPVFIKASDVIQQEEEPRTLKKFKK